MQESLCFSVSFNTFSLAVPDNLLTHTHTHTHYKSLSNGFEKFFSYFIICARKDRAHGLIGKGIRRSLVLGMSCLHTNELLIACPHSSIGQTTF